MEIAAIVVSFIAIVIAAFGVFNSKRANQISKDSVAQMKSGKRQTMYQDLVEKFMIHNWRLYEHRISPQLPGTASLTDHEWNARIVILDHLNLLFYVYLHASDSQGEVVTSEDLEGWKRWATNWMDEIQKTPTYESQFHQIISSEDLHPEHFLVWLNDNIFRGKLDPYLSADFKSRHYSPSHPK